MSIILINRISVIIYLLIFMVISMPTHAKFEFIDQHDFFFNKVSNTQIFEIEVLENVDYELAIATKTHFFTNKVVEEQPFEWEIEVNVWKSNDFVGKQSLGPLAAGWPLGYELEFLSEISLGIIKGINGKGKYKLQIKVNKIDDRFTENFEGVIIGIRPSPLH